MKEIGMALVAAGIGFAVVTLVSAAPARGTVRCSMVADLGWVCEAGVGR